MTTKVSADSVPIPAELSDLTAGWFSQALDCDVSAVEVIDAHSGTTGRARVRLTAEGACTRRDRDAPVGAAPLASKPERVNCQKGRRENSKGTGGYGKGPVPKKVLSELGHSAMELRTADRIIPVDGTPTPQPPIPVHSPARFCGAFF